MTAYVRQRLFDLENVLGWQLGAFVEQLPDIALRAAANLGEGGLPARQCDRFGEDFMGGAGV